MNKKASNIKPKGIPYNQQEETFNSNIEEPVIAYIQEPFDLIKMAREGILKKTLLQLSKKLSITLHELAKILHISERTLQRYKDKDTLSMSSSERALMLAQLYKTGIDVFGTADNFKDWLRTPLPVFQQKTPLAYLDTSFGFQLVNDELGRISHGVFA